MSTAATMRLPISRWSIEDRPTEKLQRLGTDSLTDAELLAILIGSGTQQYSAVDIAKHVMGKFNNNLNTLGKARFDEFEDIEGVGTQTACKIMAAVELGKRRQAATAELRPDMSTATRIYNYMLPKMQDLNHEEFWVLLMNQNYKLLKAERISIGGITETSADIRIIMREAVLNNATILAAVHNHPSGSLTPSRADDTLTTAIKNACSVMRIYFLDHVIVTDGAFYSFHEMGKL
ncbi:MAG: DNA repair protein RadC [Prevotella sp.]|jgi:DNA repair protein RadC|nr:DNA repair protein RadC [Prevotella sp.]MBR1557895.1 DNA repair protein RadC [Prevotella sp.]